MPLHRVVALVREPTEQARIRGALRGSGALVPCDSPDDVLDALAEESAVAVIVAGYGPAVPETIALTRTLRLRHPAMPVLVYHDPQHTPPRVLLEFFQAGAADVVERGREDLRLVFTSLLSTAGIRANARRLFDELRHFVPASAQPVFQYLLEKSEAPLSIDEVTSAIGIGRRALERRLEHLGYPPPETLIGWCRLLLAAQLLEDQGRTFDEVASELSFPSGMALRSMLRRYTGVTPRDVRDGDGPVAFVLQHLTSRLSTPEAVEAIRGGGKVKRKARTPRRPPA